MSRITRPPSLPYRLGGSEGFVRLFKATIFSLKGLSAAWKCEAAFRQELILSAFLIPAAYWAGRDGLERALLVAVILHVLIVELLNSAIEAIVDRIGLAHHPLSGRAKDTGSAAVFLSLLNACLVWVTVIFF